MQATFVAEQLNTLGVTFSLGIAIGLCYDALNVLLIFIRLSKTAQFVIDLLFCLVMTALVFMVLLVNSWGVVRAYTFLAMGAGGLCYYLFCHRWCQSLMVRVVKFIIAAARFLQTFYLGLGASDGCCAASCSFLRTRTVRQTLLAKNQVKISQ